MCYLQTSLRPSVYDRPQVVGIHVVTKVAASGMLPSHVTLPSFLHDHAALAQSAQIGHMRQSMVCTCWQPPPSQHWKCPSGVYQKHGCNITAVHGTHLSDSCRVTTVVLPLHDELYHCQCIIIRTQYMLFMNEYTIFNCLRSWDLVQNSKVLLVVTTVPLSFVLNRLRPPDTGADAYVWSYQPGALQRCLNCYQHLNITHGTAGWGDVCVCTDYKIVLHDIVCNLDRYSLLQRAAFKSWWLSCHQTCIRWKCAQCV